jgi:topoisomerase-4 subunit B
MIKQKDVYDESSIQVLKGLEPVWQRPDMYTRTESPAHIIQEVIDNAADEALGGYAKNIDVELMSDGSITISDNGRGIPVGPHPTEKVAVVTLAFTQLHAGGKFNKQVGGAYAFSGGLHGVGVAVTTALSHRVEVKVRRGGRTYEVEYVDGGRKIGQVRETGTCAATDTGTTVRVWPDEKYFHSPKIPINEIERLLRSKAVLLPGVRVTLTIDGVPRTWEYPGGMADYLGQLANGIEAPVPIYFAEQYTPAETIPESGSSATSGANGSNGTSGSAAAFAPGEGGAFAFSWYPDGGVPSESYVNLIPTPAGGTHESGLKAGVYEAVKSFIDHRALLPRGVKLQQEDVAAKMAFVMSAKVLDPQFQGQTKEKLNNRTATRLISSMVRDPFEVWLNANVEIGKLIAEIAIKHALSRQKTAQKVEKRKGSGVTLLPGKLTDCESSGGELFLVEGDSAGGSAKMARNRDNQALLPLRGKVLNTWEVDADQLFKNNEIHDISVAIGVDPHTMETATPQTLANLRYSLIIPMTDADVDGAHIQALLLTLFYKHFPMLLVNGHVAVGQPPLFKIDVSAVGKKPLRRIYALDEQEKQAALAMLAREGVRDDKIEISRFKGLGEMNADQLRETSMDPNTRRLLPMVYDPTMAQEMNRTFDLLMGKSEAEGRRQWMGESGHLADADI